MSSNVNRYVTIVTNFQYRSCVNVWLGMTDTQLIVPVETINRLAETIYLQIMGNIFLLLKDSSLVTIIEVFLSFIFERWIGSLATKISKFHFLRFCFDRGQIYNEIMKTRASACLHNVHCYLYKRNGRRLHKIAHAITTTAQQQYLYRLGV